MKLSKRRRAKNGKMFGCENLKVPIMVALDKMKALAGAFNSSLSIRKKLDLLIAHYEEILVGDITIIKCSEPPTTFGASRQILGSTISLVTDAGSETNQIWIPFGEWNKLGKDFEKVYKKYID